MGCWPGWRLSRKTWDLGEMIYHAGLLFITKGESYFVLSKDSGFKGDNLSCGATIDYKQ